MDKLTIATKVLLKLIETDKTGFDAEGIAGYAWEITDAMQAEAEKRNKEEAEQKRKEIREMLNAPNTFVEREGQHFDDVEEWQPDWSKAPEWAKWWAMDADSDCYWFENKPDTMSVTWVPFNASEVGEAPSFDYQGNWKESLRERTEPKCEVDWSVAPSWAKYWAVRDGGYEALWCVNKPTVTDDCLLSHGGCSPAPSFGFTGTHIVERPNGF